MQIDPITASIFSRWGYTHLQRCRAGVRKALRNMLVVLDTSPQSNNSVAASSITKQHPVLTFSLVFEYSPPFASPIASPIASHISSLSSTHYSTANAVLASDCMCFNVTLQTDINFPCSFPLSISRTGYIFVDNLVGITQLGDALVCEEPTAHSEDVSTTPQRRAIEYPCFPNCRFTFHPRYPFPVPATPRVETG